MTDNTHTAVVRFSISADEIEMQMRCRNLTDPKVAFVRMLQSDLHDNNDDGPACNWDVLSYDAPKPDVSKLVFTYSHMERDDDRIEHCFGTQVPGVYADLYRDLPSPHFRGRLRIDTDLSDFQLLLPITHPDDVQALFQRVPAKSTYDDANALAEGWAVFDGHANGLQIQRDDEAAIFDSDLAAWVHVITKANEGSALHKEALRQVRDDNETDWAKMDLVAYGMGIESLEEIL